MKEDRELTWTEKKYFRFRAATRIMFAISGAMIVWAVLEMYHLLRVGAPWEAWFLPGGFLSCGLLGLVVAFACRDENRSGLGRRVEIAEWRTKQQEKRKREQEGKGD